MPQIREDKIHRLAQFRSNQRSQHKYRCVRHDGVGDRHAQEDGPGEIDPKVVMSDGPKFSSVQFDHIARYIPMENHRHGHHGDEQTSVAGSGARCSEL